MSRWIKTWRPRDDDYGAGSPTSANTAALPGLQETADQKGVRALFDAACQMFSPLVYLASPWMDHFSFFSRATSATEEVLVIDPRESDKQNGLQFTLYLALLGAHLGVSESTSLSEIRKAFPGTSATAPAFLGNSGFFKTVQEIEHAATVVAEARPQKKPD